MERKENGYFISDEEIRQTGKILGVIGLGFIAVRLISCLLWPPVIRIKHE